VSRGVLFFDNPVPALPVMFLWPNSGCDCRCVMCDIWTDRSRRTIAPADVELWADEWYGMGIRFVILTGGEALMHPDLWSICQSLNSRSINVSLLSTGLTLRRHAENVVRHCNGVTVSLDGPPHAHDRIRRVPRAHRFLAEGVEALRTLAPDYRVYGRCAVHRHNFRLLRGTVAFAHEIGLNRISFLAADVTSEAFNRPHGWLPDRQAEIALGADDLDDLERELDALTTEYANDFASGFINESESRLRTKLLGYYRAHNGYGDFPEVECNAPWGSAVVEFDGTVRPCFFHKPYGNLHEAGSLDAVLNSPAAVEFRANLDLRTNPICRRCVCTFSIKRCDCALSRQKPSCDNSCLLLDLLDSMRQVPLEHGTRS
jgi:Fe-coproporphyrin III synthase